MDKGEMRGLTAKTTRDDIVLGWWYRPGEKSTEPLERKEFQEQASTESVNDQQWAFFVRVCALFCAVFCFCRIQQVPQCGSII